MAMKPADLADRMDKELPKAWAALKGFPMPAGGDPLDRLVLFHAVARGFFAYLVENEGDFLKSITFKSFSTTNIGDAQVVKAVDFDIEAPA
jgi:hypothetical protein